MKKIILMCLFGLMVSQTELTTRVYDMNVSIPYGQNINFDLDEITGYNITEAVFYVLSVDVMPDTQIQYSCNSMYPKSILETNGNNVFYQHYNINNNYKSDDNCILANLSNHDISNVNFKIVVIAEFPIEDTGYIEEGFDFCLVPGNNLVAFPCDNPVSVETAIPELAQAEIEQIIGAGQAATNLNGQFIGSLSNFTPGAGYWFKSSSSMCFNYACAE